MIVQVAKDDISGDNALILRECLVDERCGYRTGISRVGKEFY